MERNPDSRAQANRMMEGKSRSEVKEIKAKYWQFPDYQDAGDARLNEIEHEESLALQRKQHTQKQWFTVFGWLVAALCASGWLRECSISKENATKLQSQTTAPPAISDSTTPDHPTAGQSTSSADSTLSHKTEGDQSKATLPNLDTPSPKN